LESRARDGCTCPIALSNRQINDSIPVRSSSAYDIQNSEETIPQTSFKYLCAYVCICISSSIKYCNNNYLSKWMEQNPSWEGSSCSFNHEFLVLYENLNLGTVLKRAIHLTISRTSY
jgi:hypothetical protein